MRYYIDYCCTRYYLELLGKIKFLTEAKNYYFDQLAKYYQKLKFIGCPEPFAGVGYTRR